MISDVLARMMRARALLRLTPFDVGTADGRAAERHRRYLLTVVTAAASKTTAALVILLAVPMTLGYLGNERYGLWMSIVSMIAVLGFADLGIGNGILNAVAEANGRDDLQSVRRYVSSALGILTLVAAGIAAAFLVLDRLVAWPAFFKLKSPLAIAEVQGTLAVFALSFAGSIPLNTVQRLQLALQTGYVANSWMAAGNLCALVALTIAAKCEAGLPVLALAVVTTPLAVSVLNVLRFFVKHPELVPRFEHFSYAAAKKILHLGFFFLVLQAVVALAFSSDAVIIARLLGPEQVTQYAVPMQMFDLMGMAFSMALMPLWPAYGEAYARGDIAWVRRTFGHSLIVAALAAGTGALFLTLLGNVVLELWVGHAMDVSLMLLAGLGLRAVAKAVGDSLGVLMNGLSIVRFQIVVSIVFAAVCVALKIVFVRSFGLPAMPWATVIAYCSISMVASGVYLRKFFARAASGAYAGSSRC